FPAAACADLNERQRVIAVAGKQEGAAPSRTFFSQPEHMIDRSDHGFAGAEVGIQVVVPASGSLAGLEVGEDIRAAEGVDRLLGIPDQEQAMFRIIGLDTVDAIIDTVLQRVGILEL